MRLSHMRTGGGRGGGGANGVKKRITTTTTTTITTSTGKPEIRAPKSPSHAARTLYLAVRSPDSPATRKPNILTAQEQPVCPRVDNSYMQEANSRLVSSGSKPVSEPPNWVIARPPRGL
ncbi:hypothetical protein E2C01_079757 [Portunus trituberculatus]|uniref:Uncharacterized protein n=1 Tax=Portunus trituberculatus TaxID=210409 RepID=A0A5B7IKD0_PORTR|nr:hypothetical protein [Portunus trituberculatus]